MKKYSLSILFAFFSLFAIGQRNLQFEESSDLIPFSTDKDEGLVIISCSEFLKLDFRTNWNESIKFFKENETEGGDLLYYLLFPTEKEYNGRRLYISTAGFNSLTVPIVLQAKETKKIKVFDPSAPILDNCYNQLTREAEKLFSDGLYTSAKDKYILSKECPDFRQDSNADERIVSIDSIVIWRQIADRHMEVLDRTQALNYSQASEYYYKIQALNPEDKYVSSRINDCRQKENEKCSSKLADAERLFFDKKNDNAKILYEDIVSSNCNNAPQATLRLQEIGEMEKNKKQLSHVLTYELASNTPIGISTGNYKEHKTSGYFTLRFNPDVFEALRSNPDDTAKPEFNLSFGWTIKVIKPIWVFFGPGYTGVGEYVYEEKDINKEDDPRLKIHSAISPEIGLLGKIKINKGFGIALRYTFQYRFALKKDTEDYIGNTKHAFGLGFCF
jgi:hypothetical protein